MKNFKVGLQLFSVRDKMEQDMEKTLRAVKEMGYDCVEFAGCYYGKSASHLKALLDEIGLECASVHHNYDVFFYNPEECVDYIKTLGAKFCAIPFMGIDEQKGYPDFERTVEILQAVGGFLKKNGITLLYHNHEFEFDKYQDKYLFDWLYESVGLDLLKPEIDTCWVKYSGADLLKCIEKYANHIDVIHLKDFDCKGFANGTPYGQEDTSVSKNQGWKSREENNFKFKTLGTGMQDFTRILSALENTNAKYLIVEQDWCYNEDSLEVARQSREYLKTLGI